MGKKAAEAAPRDGNGELIGPALRRRNTAPAAKSDDPSRVNADSSPRAWLGRRSTSCYTSLRDIKIPTPNGDQSHLNDITFNNRLVQTLAYAYGRPMPPTPSWRRCCLGGPHSGNGCCSITWLFKSMMDRLLQFFRGRREEEADDV